MWEPVKGNLLTRWSREVNPEQPLPEYPRPQIKRKEWLNLNGLWDYSIRPKDEEMVDSYEGKILVPFPLESALSGVSDRLKSNQRLWYHRKFSIPSQWKNKKILLHFGAVDWKTIIWINHQKIGFHNGGYTPFSFDISDFVKYEGENSLVVAVWDPTDKEGQGRGKQVMDPNTIWYTAISGIWQTVWLEPVSNTYIKRIIAEPDVDNNLIRISLETQNPHDIEEIYIEVREEENVIFSVKEDTNKTFSISIPSPKLWSPQHPFLYDLIVTLNKGTTIIDRVESYFGMRKISLGEEQNGVRPILLNNKRIFQYGTLDQGYWPDGLYTAPTDSALKYDIEITKEFGFNLIRKHVKVEPARWYYHCDKIGVLVWQDMPSGGDSFGTRNINDFKETRKVSEQSDYYDELSEMIAMLFNHPSIIMWVPFNEGWGQFRTQYVCEKVRKLDPSRLINAASGWFDFGVGDICDNHSYPNPFMPESTHIKSRAYVVGEFGGLSIEIENHTWKTKDKFGYRSYQERSKLMKKYSRLISRLKDLIVKGLSAAIYTQITDVEGEINGLLTYDREVIKFNEKELIELNKSVFQVQKD
ncbi:MAG: glycoside hydrolase family 2 protein [Candidatus Hermodarchaeota archaeon]